MLLHLTDAEGRETWINPIHVKVIRTRSGLLGGKKGCEVWFSFNSASEAIYFSEDPSDIAALVNAAMPPILLVDSSDEEQPPPHIHGATG